MAGFEPEGWGFKSLRARFWTCFNHFDGAIVRRLRQAHGVGAHMSRISRTRFEWKLLALAFLAPLAGCAAYTTPARGVSMESLARADADIRERMLREPAAPFPARIALVRVQESGYHSFRSNGYGQGNFSVVTTRDVEEQKDFDRLARLPMIAGIAPINRLIVPAQLESDKQLRVAAASVKADLLLAYTFDTTFRINGKDVGPLGLVTLGFLPIDEAIVTSTASAALFDVRTGYVYGLAESTAREKQTTNAWHSEEAADEARVIAERKAFDSLLTDFEGVWKRVVEQRATAQANLGP